MCDSSVHLQNAPGNTSSVSPWALIVVALAALLMVFGVSTGYVEGDDASLIAYHSQGRNPVLQEQYSAYSSGYDLVLSVLGNDEKVLRVGAYALQILSQTLILLLTLLIVIKDEGTMRHPSFTLMMLVMWPVYLLHGLTVLPNVTAMAVAMLSHFLLLHHRSAHRMYYAGVLFGVAVSLRWDVGLYLIVILGYRDLWKNIRSSIRFVLTTIASFTLMAAASGFWPWDVLKVVRTMSDYAQAGSYSVFGQAADMLPMLTPAAVLLAAIGVRVAFVRRRYDVLASNFCTIVAVALMTAGVMYAKYFIIVMPVIAILAHWAYENLMKGPRYVVAVFWMIALLPWLFGVKLIVSGSSWGPGFEVRSEGSMARAGFSRNPDGRVTLQDASVGFQAGYAVPVQDGYRPVYGYLHLFLGSWRDLVDSLETERVAIVESALNSERRILLADNNTAFLTTVLNRKGYMMRTSGIANHGMQAKTFKYYSSTGDSLTMMVPTDFEMMLDPNYLSKIAAGVPLPVYVRYTSRASLIRSALGENFTSTGPFTGFVR